MTDSTEQPINLKELRAACTPKQRQFAESYVGEAKFNGRKAADLAGYSPNAELGEKRDATLRVVASENLAKANVKAYVHGLLSERVMNAKEVMARVSDIASADIGAILDAKGFPDLVTAIENKKTHLIKSISMKDGEITRIELHPAYTALQDLMKHFGLLREEPAAVAVASIGSDLQNKIDQIYGEHEEAGESTG